MTNRTLVLKVLYATAAMVGTVLVGIPVYAQVSGVGTILPPVNSPPVISLPAAPMYAAAAAPAAMASEAAFDSWVASSNPVQIGVGSQALIPDSSGASKFIVYRFTVTDADGAADIQSAFAKLLKPDGSVHTAYTPAILLKSADLVKEYYAVFELKSTDPPTGLDETYKLVAKVSDAAIVSGGLSPIENLVTPGLFQYSVMVSLEPVVDVIDFGNLQANKKGTGIPVTLVNLGNVPADSVLSATDFVKGSDTIPASKIWYGPTADAAGTTFPPANANAKRDAGFNLAPTGTRIVYLAVDVPAGTPSGAYTTTITFSGAKHTGEACQADCANVTWS